MIGKSGSILAELAQYGLAKGLPQYQQIREVIEQAIQQGISDRIIINPSEKAIVYDVDTKFLDILRLLITFEEIYFSFSYLEEKEKKEDALFKSLVYPIQALSKTFLSLEKICSAYQLNNIASFCLSLARILFEVELYVRVKSLMFYVYRDNLHRAYDDSKLRFEVESKRRLFQSGP